MKGCPQLQRAPCLSELQISLSHVLYGDPASRRPPSEGMGAPSVLAQPGGHMMDVASRRGGLGELSRCAGGGGVLAPPPVGSLLTGL